MQKSEFDVSKIRKKQGFFYQPDPENDLDPTDWCTETKEVMSDEFGKTIFLTYEEAEKALGVAQNENNAKE